MFTRGLPFLTESYSQLSRLLVPGDETRVNPRRQAETAECTTSSLDKPRQGLFARSLVRELSAAEPIEPQGTRITVSTQAFSPAGRTRTLVRVCTRDIQKGPRAD